MDQQPQEGRKNIWRENDLIFDRWNAIAIHPGHCTILDNEPKLEYIRGLARPCYRPNVMNTTIPAGSRAGARPCVSTWKSTQWVICWKCWMSSQLDNCIDPALVFKDYPIK